jgi:hypothetical protein
MPPIAPAARCSRLLGLAVLIACLGLYSLASFATERRTKEIGIRKVLGAKVRDIVRLLAWQFSKPVVLANLIAWPMAWWAMREWLNTFDIAHRADAHALRPGRAAGARSSRSSRSPASRCGSPAPIPSTPFVTSRTQTMWRNYVTVGLRALAKNKVYAFINIFGLSLGIAACLLILTYVRYERSYDKWLPGARIFQFQLGFLQADRAGGSGIQAAGDPMCPGPRLLKDFPQIEKRVYIGGGLGHGDPERPGLSPRGCAFFVDSNVLRRPRDAVRARRSPRTRSTPHAWC